MSEARRLLLVYADAAARARAFELLAAAGYAVDAVGDLQSARRRLAADRYVALVAERCMIGDLEAHAGPLVIGCSPNEVESLPATVRSSLAQPPTEGAPRPAPPGRARRPAGPPRRGHG